MSSKTKIVVLHMKEVIYTAIFLVLAILLLVLLFTMFGTQKKSGDTTGDNASEVLYVPGVYTSTIELNGQTSMWKFRRRKPHQLHCAQQPE